MRRRLILTALLLWTVPAAAQTAPMTPEQRVALHAGTLAIQNIMMSAQVEALTKQVEALTKQIGELRKIAPKQEESNDKPAGN